MLAGTFEHVERADLSTLTRDGLEAFIEKVTELESFLASRRLDAMAAIDSLNDGGASSESVLRTKGKAGSKNAKKAAKTAKTLKQMPQTASALAEGKITEAHADANVAAAEQVDDPAAADDELNRSPVVPPADLHAKRVKKWANDNEDRRKAKARCERQRRNRKVIFGRSEEDGSWSLYATCNTDDGKELQGLIEAEADRLFRDDGGRGADRERTRVQRLFDSLANLIRRGAGKAAPACGRVHPRFQPMVRIAIGDYLDDVEGELIGDGPLPDAVVHQILCQAGLDVLLTADDGQPLWLGRSSRQVTAAQWRALIERDEGCVVCGAEPSRCEAHHLHWWSHQGATDITNLVLLCSSCHHDVHDRGHDLVKLDGTWHLRSKPPDQARQQRRRSSRQPRAA